ncbi:MAG: Alkane 1-monooxygenase [Bacteroidota bacterium]|jgi:alkane 1-monooxygenase
MTGLRYLLALLLPASIYVGLLADGFWSFTALGFAFGLVPVLEAVLPTFAANLSEAQRAERLGQPWYDVLVLAQIPLHLGAIALFVKVVPEDRAAGDLTSLVGHIAAMGVSCGTLAINVAHELGHRPNATYQRLAQGLLVTTLYGQFFIDHNLGHHKNVATPEDASTARYGEVLYAFWVRSIVGVWRTAWHLKPLLMAVLFTAEVLMLFGFWLLAPEALVPFLAAAVMGVLLLETVNYIEHYGLLRPKVSAHRYENAQPVHSWNSNHPLGRFMLFELTRHSDHHAHPHKPYPVLDHFDEAPQMPAGYPAMMVLAALPPLWFRVMNPRLKQVTSY